MPVIRVDDEVYEALMKRAVDLKLVFGSPNDVLKYDYLNGRGQTKKASHMAVDQSFIDVELPEGYPSQYSIIPIPEVYRDFFPGYKNDFKLETDVGVLTSHVTSAPKGTPTGAPNAGKYIAGELKRWYEHHRQLQNGGLLRIEVSQPGKVYKLSILRID